MGEPCGCSWSPSRPSPAVELEEPLPTIACRWLFPESDAATDARYDDFLLKIGPVGDPRPFDVKRAEQVEKKPLHLFVTDPLGAPAAGATVHLMPGVLEFAGGLFVLLGLRARWGALALAAFARGLV